MHKFIDDTTITEIIPKHHNSVMQIACSETETFSYNNFMNINTKKTKEMLLGSIARSTPDKLYINNLEIERVKKFKLLGITINDKLKWNEHVDSICAKVNKRLYFLKKLRRANMSGSDLLFYYKSIIRPVTKYACAVWHPGLTKSQSHSLEALQRRAFRTILSHNTDYSDALFITGLPTLADRREELTRRLFSQIQNPAHCLHYLLPNKRDPDTIAKLRHAHSYPIPTVKTTRYKKSFTIYSLEHFQ